MPSEPVVDLFQLAGTTLDGRFGVEAVIAEGGFGIVYRARQAALDRAIALKVLKMPPRFDEVAKQQFLAGFAKEARTIARISHPNIVQVYDFGVSTMPSGVQAPWMALEWLTGTTLEDALLARRGAGGRTPAECLVILRPILEALSIVHAAGVAHRDLKPANIMMVAMPTGTMPKLLDFGIAKIMDADEAPGTGSTQTRSHQIAFSPGYAAPEQISGGRSGPWTDVHAMALVATEMLVDRTPLEGNEQTLLFQQILDRLRPSPAKFGVDVGAWEAVLLRALAVSPSERFRDAGELLGALEARLAEASSTRRILPSGVSVPELSMAGAVDTLAVMSTRQCPFALPSPRRAGRRRPTPGSPARRRARRAMQRSRRSWWWGRGPCSGSRGGRRRPPPSVRRSRHR
jgi:serine/threonine protein kinase